MSRRALDRRGFLRTLSLGAASLAAGPMAFAKGRAARPNVLLIVSDDQGYADLGCYGSQEVKTPHLDRLARGGIVLSQRRQWGRIWIEAGDLDHHTLSAEGLQVRRDPKVGRIHRQLDLKGAHLLVADVQAHMAHRRANLYRQPQVALPDCHLCRRHQFTLLLPVLAVRTTRPP